MQQPSSNEQRNLIIAAGLSFAVIVLWQAFVVGPQIEDQKAAEAARQAAIEEQGGAQSGALGENLAAGGSAVTGLGGQPVDLETALKTSGPRLEVETPKITGSLALEGARIDQLRLSDYDETIERNSDNVELLWPAGTRNAYFAHFGWLSDGGVATPNLRTEWVLAPGSAPSLKPGATVSLLWDNGAGLVFTRRISVDEDYLFTVEQSVENRGDAPVKLQPNGVIERHGVPQIDNFWVVHEGPIGQLSTDIDAGAAAESSLQVLDYDDLAEGAPQFSGYRGNAYVSGGHGWLGFTDKYWLTALAPADGKPFRAFLETRTGSTGEPIYRASVLHDARAVAPGASHVAKTHFFAGAKEIGELRDYQYLFDGKQEPTTFLGKLNDFFFYDSKSRFVDAIDWGWFFFLTKPIFEILVAIKNVVGNMGVAIILLTVLFKTLLFPLAYKSYVSMSKLKKLQPEMKKIQERAGDDRQKMQMEMMGLYKKEKVNPAAGCLPIFLQIPIFFSLYKVLMNTIEIRHAPFVGWIQDLSAPDPTSLFNLFGLIPYEVPAFLLIGFWPILMGVSMWIQQMLNPAPADPMQEKIFNLLPLVFTFMLGTFASGLVIYWFANNVLTIIQQYSIMRSQGVKPDILGNIKRQLGLAPKEGKS